jgi:hypothetical protein
LLKTALRLTLLFAPDTRKGYAHVRRVGAAILEIGIKDALKGHFVPSLRVANSGKEK